MPSWGNLRKMSAQKSWNPVESGINWFPWDNLCKNFYHKRILNLANVPRISTEFRFENLSPKGLVFWERQKFLNLLLIMSNQIGRIFFKLLHTGLICFRSFQNYAFKGWLSLETIKLWLLVLIKPLFLMTLIIKLTLGNIFIKVKNPPGGATVTK